MVQTDSRTALALLTYPGELTHNHSLEMLQFRELLTRDWEVILKHVYQEGNYAADFLANLGHQLSYGAHLIPTSDCNLGFDLLYDSLGISESRPILSSQADALASFPTKNKYEKSIRLKATIDGTVLGDGLATWEGPLHD
ncbi:hypothetical protein LINPERHAP2_LOCUS2499 [Linum perenne]